MDKYLKIDGSKYKNIYVVGDIHGCYTKLMQSLDEREFDFNCDLLISVGDLIDRGEENLFCLQLINKKWFKCVRGNHEQMAINAIVYDNKQSMYAWLMNGGGWYFGLEAEEKQSADRLIQKCNELPLVIELSVNGKKIVIAHADYPNDYEYGKEVSNKQILWNRSRFENRDFENINGADYFIFGHTPVSEIVCKGNIHFIDTGAVFGRDFKLLKVIELQSS